VAQIIRAHEVDILIDLAGPTMDAQPDVFGFKPAPVQVLYLGYPGTSGAEYMDYILADRTVIPEEHQKFYAEKVLYLPDCYLPTDPQLVFSDRTPSRQEMSLPAEGFVFCSFNHDYKINPPVFDVWMRILARVEGSVLWLMRLNSDAEENLRKEAEKRGIEGSRLIFAVRVPSIADHLARYRLAGLFLDTTPYNAHTTATDALRAGLPVLTVEGGSFQSRVATSVLRTVGLHELAVRSLAEYEDTAVRLAEDPRELEALKARVRSQVAASRLSDATAFTLGVEAALLQCKLGPVTGR
jgi:predicted O-linked N-acetylglucosamine transferase (SPINDLY family)